MTTATAVRPPSAATPPAPGQHIDCLDGMRALAALMVMGFHFIGYHGAAPALIKASSLGQTGVDLFFVLSGFLITRILILSRESPHYFRTFYARRTLRIFPLYYGFLVVFFFVLPPLVGDHIPAFKAQLWSWVYLENIPNTFPYWPNAAPAHFWSLAIEEHFYLIWPLLVYAVPARRFRYVLAAALILPAICRAIMVRQGFTVFYFTPTRLDALAYGGLLAVLLLDDRWVKQHPRFFRWLLAGLGTVMLVAFTILAGKNYSWLHVKYSLIPAFYFAFIGFCLTDPAARPLTALLSLGWLRWLGAISYGLYVFHPVCYAVLEKFNSSVGLVPALAASLFLSIAVAYLSFRFFEAPILGLKRYFSYGSRPAVPGTGQAG